MVKSFRWMRKRLPGFSTKVTMRVLLLLIFCATLSICCFRYLMQWETWTYFQLLEQGFFDYDPERIMEEIREKAKDITFHELSQEQLEEILDLKSMMTAIRILVFMMHRADNFNFAQAPL